jgi:hypothetical protein
MISASEATFVRLMRCLRRRQHGRNRLGVRLSFVLADQRDLPGRAGWRANFSARRLFEFRMPASGHGAAPLPSLARNGHGAMSENGMDRPCSRPEPLRE